ncbi:hypothetical protein SMACR_02483 [Sordaria macrospora]|uniref:Uncharacterized protein n=1 Tax=Sordaria macrospora TaxID=5147 RepID=A0A8S8ZM31_SORMA|nr:hypothetical protein SMACR_02483 [Sordaria macrospora]
MVRDLKVEAEELVGDSREKKGGVDGRDVGWRKGEDAERGRERGREEQRDLEGRKRKIPRYFSWRLKMTNLCDYETTTLNRGQRTRKYFRPEAEDILKDWMLQKEGAKRKGQGEEDGRCVRHQANNATQSNAIHSIFPKSHAYNQPISYPHTHQHICHH